MISWTIDGTKYEFSKLYVKTQNKPFLAQKRHARESVIGRDSDVIFTGGYSNVQFTLQCEFKGATIFDINHDLRTLSGILNQPGKLRFDYEADKEYNAQLLQVQNMTPGASTNVINLVVDIDPRAKSVIKPGEGVPWGEVDIPWGLWDVPWGGYVTSFDLTSGSTLTITNAGNYKALPIIKLSADSGNVTVTLGTQSFTYTGLTSTVVNVDSEQMAVYTDALVNKKSSHSGDFIELLSGQNDIIVTGTFVNLTIEFDYQHTWI